MFPEKDRDGSLKPVLSFYGATLSEVEVLIINFVEVLNMFFESISTRLNVTKMTACAGHTDYRSVAQGLYRAQTYF